MTITKLLGCACLAAVAAAPAPAHAQSEPTPAPAASRTAGPPIERITTASAVSTERLGSIMSVRELPDGRVLVNDGARRRLLLMDTTLQTVGIVLDSLAEIANTYGTRPGALIPYRADSTLFVDPASYAMLVLDPEGKIARVRSVWRVQDLGGIVNPGNTGWPAVDARGRIVYRIPAQPARPLVAPPAGVPYIPPQPDSAFVVAVDLGTRMLDTLAAVRIPRSAVRVRRTVEGRLMFDPVINPLPVSDDWAVLSDGTVALVRAQDYRIEYLGPDGRWTSSPKLPYDWQRLTDEDKERMVDSVRTAQERGARTEYVASTIRWVNQFRRAYPPGFTIPPGYVPPPGLAREWKLPPGVELPPNYIYACAAGEEPTMGPPPARGDNPGAAAAGPVTTTRVFPGGEQGPPPGEGPGIRSRGAPGGEQGAPAGGPGMMTRGIPGGEQATGPAGAPGGTPSCIPAPVMFNSGDVPPPPAMRRANVLPASELPDYRPPLTSGGSARADADGNLWIRAIPSRPIAGGPVYDIVNRQGEMVTRLQLLPGYTIVGFGKGRVVYLSMRDPGGIRLARVRLR